MGCFGTYDFTKHACSNCHVVSSCRRERNNQYRSKKILSNVRNRHRNTTCYLGKVRNKLLETLLAYQKPLSTTRIIKITRSWRNTTASAESIKTSLRTLHRMGYLNMARKGRARYWQVHNA